jgi:hypothetical protein
MPTLNLWRLFIDFFISITLIYRFFIITIKLSFFITSVNLSFDLISNPILYTLLIIYFIELFISINTGYYHEGNVILERKLILKNHIKNWPFVTNTISHIPYLIYINFNAGQLSSQLGFLIYLMEIMGILKIL